MREWGVESKRVWRTGKMDEEERWMKNGWKRMLRPKAVFLLCACANTDLSSQLMSRRDNLCSHELCSSFRAGQLPGCTLALLLDTWTLVRPMCTRFLRPQPHCLYILDCLTLPSLLHTIAQCHNVTISQYHNGTQILHLLLATFPPKFK